MSDEDLFTDEAAETMWGWVLPAIDAIIERTQDPDEFPVKQGSQLAKDDVRSHPYEVSHCARSCLNAGVDHLHAAKTLMFDLHAPILHANADWSLIRGALDNFATAFWVLHPNQRTLRIEHTLRWRVQDYKAERQATGTLEPGKEVEVDPKIEKVIQFAKDAHCNVKEVKRGYVSKTALEYVEKHLDATNPYFMWQLCSGFAHGRPWASFAMNEMEVLEASSGPGFKSLRFTSDRKRLLTAAWPAFQLMNAVVYLYTLRAAS